MNQIVLIDNLVKSSQLLSWTRVPRGLSSTQFGLIEVDTTWKPNWILGAVQKSHV